MSNGLAIDDVLVGTSTKETGTEELPFHLLVHAWSKTGGPSRDITRDGPHPDIVKLKDGPQ